MNLIQQLEQEEIARLGKTIPEFAPGDTVVVHVRVVEGNRSHLPPQPWFEQQLYRAQNFQRRRCGTYFPTVFSSCGKNRSETPW